MPASVSIITQPDLLAPVNKELWYELNSGSSSVTDFKYIYKPQERVEPFSTNAFTSLNTYKIPPRPLTGNGLLSPHKILKSFLLSYVNPYQTQWNSGYTTQGPGILNGLLEYNIKYGYEYNPNQSWNDTYYLSGFLGLTFSTPHGLQVGDYLILDKDNKQINPSYDGTCSITQVVDTTLVKTDKAWGVDTIFETGNIISVQRLTATSSSRYAWNGTRQYRERTKDFSVDYILGSASTDKFLSSFNQTYKMVGIDDYETLSMILPGVTGSTFYVETYNQSGTLLNTYNQLIISTNKYRRVDYGVGPKNIINNGGSMTGVDNYKVYVKYNGVTASETKSYKIDTQCSIYDKMRICFLNRMGGWDYFNFTLDSKKSVSITRSEYNKMLNWNYSVGDRGKTILAQKAEELWTITSNWITEKDSIWLEELLTSPEVFILGNDDTLGGASGGYKLPIIITDNSYEVKTALRNQIFNLIINFKYSYDLNLQNE